jgi:hypothetical protein
MTNTPQSLITSALRLIGVLGSGETPSAAEAQDSLQILNSMVDSWQTERLMLHVVERQTFSLVASQANYTIGDGGDFDVDRPMKIERASYLDTTQTSPVEQRIKLLTSAQRWREVMVKDLESTVPQVVYYETTYPLGTVYVWPVPSVATVDLVLYIPTSLSSFADLTTQYDFPPGYEEALKYNLALRLAPEWERPPNPVVVELARESKALVKRANIVPQELRYSADVPGMGRRGRYNIWADG